ncbi:hypothetical protein F9278_37365 [Streptomyces phaeolivaceus]|uniref:Uncharacterized protein n=1 Tax=Streptomyces phaeolivaceus TaxID=2653200 RepID=A0A5P8KDQ6_9ACTN|nr:hypothetical protein [Streptomyces phaeolivaceus]QFR00919.1 hypothetical protein F9278_37365 [Streptomyces phaeolivaceus]
MTRFGRAPVARHPGSLAFVDNGAFKEPVLLADQGGPPMHTIQLTPRHVTLNQAGKASVSGESSLGLFWDFQLH